MGNTTACMNYKNNYHTDHLVPAAKYQTFNKSQSYNITKDHFKILKVIGRGSFGKVFLVKKRDTREIFAMKVLKKENVIARNQFEHTVAEREIL